MKEISDQNHKLSVRCSAKVSLRSNAENLLYVFDSNRRNVRRTRIRYLRFRNLE